MRSERSSMSLGARTVRTSRPAPPLQAEARPVPPRVLASWSLPDCPFSVLAPKDIDLRSLRIDAPARRVTGDGARVASYTGIERVRATGQIARVTFRGGRADELFYASARRVRATGGGGNDRLDGSRGADVLDGGPGRDVLAAGPGRDRCVRGERLSSCEIRR